MAATCPHLKWIRQPAKSAIIHKEECTQCFNLDSSAGGVDVCLSCFNGGCTGADSANHSARHAKLCHPIVLNIKKRDIIKPEEDASMAGDAAPAAAASASASSSAASSSGEPASKVTKLAIGGPGGVEVSDEPTFFYETQARCLECKINLEPSEHEPLKTCVAAILEAQSASRPTEVAWEEAPEENCPHCVNLEQVASPPQLGERALTTCASCDVKTDMWLCLTCGALGCSRRQMIGAGTWSLGQGHAAAHAAATGHKLVHKIGTINAEGKGECYCYQCDNAVINSNLAKQMETFGIITSADTVATTATTADLSLEMNLKMNWSLVFEEDGREAELAFGPGHTGLTNLGNSCYLASVLQVLFALPTFQQRYFAQAEQHLATCESLKPSECFQCQMSKLAWGMLSGTYDPQPSAEEMAQIAADRAAREARNKLLKEQGAVPSESDNKKRKKPLQLGVAPRMFKRLVAGKHAEFSSARQQDSLEYVHFLLDYIKQKEHAAKFDPYGLFTFQQEERLECTTCHGVRYATAKTTELALTIPLPAPLPPQPEPVPLPGEKPRKPAPKEYPPVSFKSCVDEFTQASLVDSWVCPHCKVATQARKSSRLATFPPVLMVAMKRFVYDGWVPEKLDIQVQLTEAERIAEPQVPIVDLDVLRAKGIQAGEVALPVGDSSSSSSSSAAAAAPQPDPAIVANLESMGFGQNACKRAALAVSNAGPDAAAAWLFAHMEDADVNDPLPEPKAASSGSASAGGANEPSAEAIAGLECMGFDARRCKYALKQCGGSAERAIEWLFSHAEEDIPDESAAAASSSSEKKEDDEVMLDAAPAGYELFAFVTHMGKSTGSGHYIAHVLKAGKWLQYNDHKVSFVTQPMRAAAYAYLLYFRRV